jgi:hypothetical protein
MKSTFKPLGIAAAVAAVTAGYANAQGPVVSNNGFGDLALIPYYTVQEEYVTGVHIINSSAYTQVLKVRLRRASDSMDALDFNLILSPYDMWVGFLNDDANGTISFNTEDNSCTAPATNPVGKFVMPPIYRDGADEGYIEIIGMGSIEEESPIGVASLHDSDGMPADCVAVRSNFFSIQSGYPGTPGNPAVKGVINFATTHQSVADTAPFVAAKYTCTTTKGAGLCVNEFNDGMDAIKVSYFIRDNASGVEFGGEAVHIAGFLNEPAMSNQQLGLSGGDKSGFDYPDLNGGSLDGTQRNRFNLLRSPSVLGATAVVNDWSANPVNGVSTDWVVTMPGQYTMLDLADYTDGFSEIDEDGGVCATRIVPNVPGPGDDDICDRRDIPVEVGIAIYDREEGSFTPDPGDLVVSPQPPVENPVYTLPYEVNVIQWDTTGVLGSDKTLVVDNALNPLASDFGWAYLTVTGRTRSVDPAPTGPGDVTNDVPAVCELPSVTFGPVTPNQVNCTSVSGNVPVIGMVAWKRNVAANPNASYGRIVEHAYVNAS